MVGLKRKEICENKINKNLIGCYSEGKLHKNFATRALSMVLCFVMLFMGVPVTAWAQDELYITTKNCSSAIYELWIAPGEVNKVELFYGGSHAKAAMDAGGVTWSSSDTDETYVKLLSGGYVQGVLATEIDSPVTITATSKADSTITATINVVVTDDVSSITIADYNDDELFDMKVGKSYQLTASVLDSSSADEIDGAAIQWSSSDPTVVTVDAFGQLTAVDVGDATITASCAGKHAIMDVKVIDSTFYISDSYHNPLSVLKLSVGETYELFYSGSAGNIGNVTFSSSDEDVATVSADHGVVQAKKAGTTTITATDGRYSASITVTVVEGTPVTFDFQPLSPVYNKDLALSGTPWARKHMMIGTINADAKLTYFDTITVVNSHGETTVDAEYWDHCICDDEWALSAAEGGDNPFNGKQVDGLRDVGYLANDRLPVCLDMPSNYDYRTVLDLFSIGKNKITLTTIGGESYTTYITIANNEPQVGTQWTKGSSEGLLIAKIPNLNNKLLDTLITNLVIKQDGTRFFDGQPSSEILNVDDQTGDVYIKKEILDPLDPGTYTIGFRAGEVEELFNFVIVAESNVSTLATDVTISEDNVKTGDPAIQLIVASLGSIIVLALSIILRLITRKKQFED